MRSGMRVPLRKSVVVPATPRKPSTEKTAGIMQHQGRERNKAARLNSTFPFSLISVASLTSILLIIIFPFYLPLFLEYKGLESFFESRTVTLSI